MVGSKLRYRPVKLLCSDFRHGLRSVCRRAYGRVLRHLTLGKVVVLTDLGSRRRQEPEYMGLSGSLSDGASTLGPYRRWRRSWLDPRTRPDLLHCLTSAPLPLRISRRTDRICRQSVQPTYHLSKLCLCTPSFHLRP